MAVAKFQENRFRIDEEIAENHVILVNFTASRLDYSELNRSKKKKIQAVAWVGAYSKSHLKSVTFALHVFRLLLKQF